MNVAAGTRLGRYVIRSKIGAGGMGEVYRARDDKLNRDVAIKVLPVEFSQDGNRLWRFEQEAQAAGSLNDPNILAVYDVGTHDDAPYVVSELLEGESLKDRLHDGAITQRKVIDYAVQVAHGLAAAHEKGIVHRDLKPDNIFITKEDHIKILDFGIAKLVEPVSDAVGQTDIATRKVHTNPGTAIGTPGYMSPEQVRGQKVDHRSDIFSFGAVLYEMLSGQRAFRGESAVETLNAILKDEPKEIATADGKISPAIERIVWHCLEKSPERRFQSATDIAFALESLSGSSGVSSETVTAVASLPARRRISKHLPWIVSAILFIALVALLPVVATHLREAPAEVRAVRSFIPSPEKASFEFVGLTGGPLTMSPDGRRVAFAARTGDGKRLLWVRSLDALTAQALTGTEGASFPFWSPDSRFIGFFADGKLKKIEASGGPALTLCEAPQGRGGTWNRDGMIVFAPNSAGALQQVSASGGVSSAVTKLDEVRGEVNHRWPSFLPDSRHFLYLGRTVPFGESETNAIYVGSLESKESKLLFPANSNVVYAQGYLLFVRENTLMAQPFDAKRLATMGDAFPVAEQIQYEANLTRGVFAVSENGVLAYQTGDVGRGSQLTWFDRTGKQVGALGDPAPYGDLKLSPDGKRVAAEIRELQFGHRDLWLYDVARGTRTRFTFDPSGAGFAAWSADGSHTIFASNRQGHSDIYQKASNGVGSEEVLLQDNLNKINPSCSSDGRFLLFSIVAPKTGHRDLWVLPLSGDRKPFPFLQSGFGSGFGQFSPDGNWVAYSSTESGRPEIYVAPFPGPGSKRQISTAGGLFPRWRADGKEIFYLAPDNKFIAAEVNPHGATLEVGAVLPLFEVRPSLSDGYPYDVTADGQRFLVNTVVEQKASAPITLVINWTADLKK